MAFLPPSFMVPIIVILPQTPYTGGQVRHRSSASAPIAFGSVNLSDIALGHMDGCTDHTERAFPPEVVIGDKLSIRLQFEGHPGPPYRHQANIGRVSRRFQPTRGDLAAFIARGLKRFLVIMTARGTPLSHNGREVLFEDLYLIDVVLVSKGSVQPTIGIRSMFNVQASGWHL